MVWIVKHTIFAVIEEISSQGWNFISLWGSTCSPNRSKCSPNDELCSPNLIFTISALCKLATSLKNHSCGILYHWRPSRTFCASFTVTGAPPGNLAPYQRLQSSHSRVLASIQNILAPHLRSLAPHSVSLALLSRSLAPHSVFLALH